MKRQQPERRVKPKVGDLEEKKISFGKTINDIPKWSKVEKNYESGCFAYGFPDKNQFTKKKLAHHYFYVIRLRERYPSYKGSHYSYKAGFACSCDIRQDGLHKRLDGLSTSVRSCCVDEETNFILLFLAEIPCETYEVLFHSNNKEQRKKIQSRPNGTTSRETYPITFEMYNIFLKYFEESFVLEREWETQEGYKYSSKFWTNPWYRWNNGKEEIFLSKKGWTQMLPLEQDYRNDFQVIEDEDDEDRKLLEEEENEESDSDDEAY